MSEDFITSVQVCKEGLIEEVDVFVRGCRVGTLYVGPGEGERMKNALLGAKYFGIDRPVESPLTSLELVEWRVMATGWLEVDEIGMSETGFVGRLVLRLLDEIHRLKAAFVPRPMPELPALVKDFHVLYRAAERLVADLDAEKLTDLDYIKLQLRRLMPAFEECEAARRMVPQTKEGN